MSNSFQDMNLNAPLYQALEKMGITQPTLIQVEAHAPILSGRDVVGISQTGTGKTFAYLLPLLKNMQNSRQIPPQLIIMVPTRELVVQVVEEVEKLTEFMPLRVGGVYGGTNMNTQKFVVTEGLDVLVGTPGRLYDLMVEQHLSTKLTKKFVIDEIDVMLDLGFRFQIMNILELLPKCQHIMFSATMTDEVANLIEAEFQNPLQVSVAKSGTPLENIEQNCYWVANAYTKVNLLGYILADKENCTKVLIFVANKRQADWLYEELDNRLENQVGVIHSNKSQNFRLNALDEFKKGKKRVLIATDIMARGIDIDDISHVINFDVPQYPENYMHRIGRTGRAAKKGVAITLATEKEWEDKEAIEAYMELEMNWLDFPEDIPVAVRLTEEEKPKQKEIQSKLKQKKIEKGASSHEKSKKNQKVNLGGSYHRKIKEKYKKPKTRGDKGQNRKKR